MPHLKRLTVCAAVCGVVLFAAPAAADQLVAEQHEGESGYTAIEELSYEAIVEASHGYAATLRLRVALHNSSLTTRDAVHSLTLPFAAQVVGVRAARGGSWQDGQPTKIAKDPGRRDPGTVFVRELAPESKGDIPGAELVAFGLEPGATIQVEISARVHPRLRGDRWELELPARGHTQPELAPKRRVLVKGLRASERFFVDGSSNNKKPYIVTNSVDTVVATWPAHIKSRSTLDGSFEVMPGPPGFDDGDFRLYLRLGPTSPARPDHIIVLIDRSLSTSSQLPTHTDALVERLFDALPASTTFDAIGFTRHAVPLLEGVKARPKVGNTQARAALTKALKTGARGQGTDLGGALKVAAKRARGKRPLIVVVTDGMLPATAHPGDVRAQFRSASKRRLPDVLFVVDDPVLIRSGLSPRHPVSRVAAALGARISLKGLAQLGAESGTELLGAPKVLGGLDIDLAENMQLNEAVPDGLVAGGFVMLTGRYVGKPATTARIRGSFAGKTVTNTVKAKTLPRRPHALAAVTEGDLQQAATEGFAQPPWYQARQRREARRGIAQAGRSGYEQRGFLDKKIFRHYLTTRVLPRARVCYNRALTRKQDQSGRIVLEMEVGKGEVMLAKSTGVKLGKGDAKLVECMTEAAWALDIPAGKLDDRIYIVRYPLNLVAPKHPGGGGTIERGDDEALQVYLAAPIPKR